MGTQIIHPPVNVRIEHPDGTHTPVECVYTGTTSNGLHHWHTVRDVELNEGDWEAWDEMPPFTEVHLYRR